MDKIYAALGQQVHVRELGIELFVAVNDDGQPTVAISTEGMLPQYVYDEATGLPGTAEPYTYEASGDSVAVKDAKGATVALHFPQPDSTMARLAARTHVQLLNQNWPAQCGMPDVQVMLGDVTLYDSEDHNPALRERNKQATAS